jgi:hypothetical protein
MVISNEQYRQFRVRTHHLDQRLPAQQLLTAAGTIGFQNSPPGAWEQAVFNRIADITAAELRAMLEKQKSLLQAWSFRGAPAAFPTQDAAVFLNALVAEKNEDPWIYTAGLVPSLPQLGIDYTTLLTVVGQATKAVLADKTITGKGQLDAAIADAVAADLPAAKQAAWQQPSLYGAKQTLGEARCLSCCGRPVFKAWWYLASAPANRRRLPVLNTGALTGRSRPQRRMS